MSENPPTEMKRKRRRGAKARLVEKESVQNIEKKRKLNKSASDTNPVPAVKIDANGDSSNMDKKKRKKRKKRGIAPKPGEDGYLTATQMRNARKRRAKQKKGDQASEVSEQGAEGKKTKKRKAKKSKLNNDPSMKYINDPKSAPLVQKAVNFFAQKNVPFQTFIGPLKGWRTVCKLPVRRTNDEEKTCVIGLFKPKSHTIVSVPDCPAHHPSINSTIQILQNICNRLSIVPYDESTGEGLFRYVCINVERSTGKVQMTIIWNSSPYIDNDIETPGKKDLETLTGALLEEKCDIQFHSLWVHHNAQWKHADNMFDFGSDATEDKKRSLWKLIHGPREIVDILDLSQNCKLRQPCDIELHFPPNTFRQANIDAFTNIIATIRSYIATYNEHRQNKEKGSKNVLPSCAELYGGVGTIGLNICDLTRSFISSDENPYNKSSFIKSVGKMPSSLGKKCRYVSKNATAMIQEEDVFSKENDCSEIIIVDPPRKGLDEIVLNEVCNCDSRLLIYVSCGFDAFQRDCEALLSSSWKLDKAEGHLLFPGSDAIESLAFFTKVK
jgi:tRNA/tmRNA/rRNA uracil-C5-methylase (TrmA/RlmC/RlmD family)